MADHLHRISDAHPPWRRRKGPPSRFALQRRGDLPGSQFRSLAVQLRISRKPGCNCEEVEAEMDLLGVAGCRSARQRLLAALRNNYARYNAWDKIRAGAAAVGTGLHRELEWRDPVASLFDLAVRRAEAAATSPAPASPSETARPPGDPYPHP